MLTNKNLATGLSTAVVEPSCSGELCEPFGSLGRGGRANWSQPTVRTSTTPATRTARPQLRIHLREKVSGTIHITNRKGPSKLVKKI